MSQNPYASPETEPPADWRDQPEGPQRTSLLAVASIVCSIPCCVLPGMGLVGIGLGAASLGLISHSQGRLSGKPAAITGIFLGLLATVAQLAVGFGFVQGWNFYSKQMVPTAEALLTSAAASDYDAARLLMPQQAGEATPDRRFQLFIDEIESRQGPIQGANARFGELFNAFGRVYGSSQGQQGPAGSQPQSTQDVYPIPLVVACDQGNVLAWALLSADALNQQRVEIVDMMALFEGGEAITLRADGPARDMAKQVATTIIDLEQSEGEAPDEQESTTDAEPESATESEP